MKTDWKIVRRSLASGLFVVAFGWFLWFMLVIAHILDGGL